MSRLTEEQQVGLCLSCVHSRVVQTPRSTFWMCRLSATDPRFAKYPRLPVVACAGYERAAEEKPAGDNGDA